jgi:hypothetical protein
VGQEQLLGALFGVRQVPECPAAACVMAGLVGVEQ